MMPLGNVAHRASAPAGMPSGALGIWYAKDYVSASRAIPNSVTGITPQNLIRFSRRLSNSFGGTWTEGQIAADGSNGASRLVGSGNYASSHNLGTLPAGTYTFALSVKSNTGVSQTFKMSWWVDSAVKTATTSWTRQSGSFTIGSPTSVVGLIIQSADGTTGNDLLLADVGLYKTASDPFPDPATPDLSGALYLGRNILDAGANVSGGVLDLVTNAPTKAIIQLPATQSLTAVTALAIVQKRASAGGDYHATFSKIGNNGNDFSTLMNAGIGTPSGPKVFFNNAQSKQAWSPNLEFGDGNYHMIAHRYDGATLDMFIDDILFSSTAAASLSAVSVDDLWVGAVNGGTAGYYVNSQALYNRALTNTEIRNAYADMKAKASLSSITVSDPTRVYIAEGDSITNMGNGSVIPYPNLYQPNASPAIIGGVEAESGSTLTNMNARAAKVDASIYNPGGNRKFILSVYVGVNDYNASPTAAAFAANLATYCDARRAAGWKVVLGTLMSARSGFDNNYNVWRNAVNAIIYGWSAGLHYDVLADFAANTNLGADAASANATYFNGDLVHPTQTGQNLMETIIRPVLNGIT